MQHIKRPRRIELWSPILVNGRYVVLAGRDEYGVDWVSANLAEVDVEARAAVTESGRPYALVGDPDGEGAAFAARLVLSQRYNLEGSIVEPITLEQAAERLARRAAAIAERRGP